MEKNPERKAFFSHARRIFTAEMMANLLYLSIGGIFAGNLLKEINPLTTALVAIGAIFFASLSISVYPVSKEEKGE